MGRRFGEGRPGATVPHTDWQRLALVFAVAALFDISAAWQMQAFTPLFLRMELGLSPDEVARWTGLLAACQLVLAIPLAPFWGALADRVGRKPIILRGYLVGVASYPISAASQSVEHLVLARLVYSLGFGIVAVTAAAQADVTPEDRIAGALSFIQMTFPVGMALGPLYGGFLVDVLGLRGLFLLNAVQELVAILLVLVFYQDRARRDRTPLRAKMRATLGRVLTAREVRGVFLTMCLLSAGAALMDPYVPVYLDRLYPRDPAIFVGVTMSVFGLTAGLLTPVAGRLADRIGRARLLGWSLLDLAGVALAMALAPDALSLAALQGLRGVPQAGTVGIVFALVALNVPGRERSAVMALLPLPRNIAGFVAPLLGAALTTLGVPAIFAAAGLAYLGAWPSG